MSRAQLTSTVEQNTGGAVAPYVAGKNLLINGSMDFWQRGISFSVGGYTADRWFVDNGTTTRQTGTGQFPYCLQIANASGNPALRQGVELPFAGNAGQFQIGTTWTISFYAKTSTSIGSQIAVYVAFNDGVNIGTNAVQIASSTTVGASSTSWTKYTYTFTVASSPSGTNTAVMVVPYLASGSYAGNFSIAQTQLEQGSVATPFSRAGGTLSGELQACQRYYQYLSAFGCFGYATGSGFSIMNTLPFLTQMRVTPTVTITSNGSTSSLSSVVIQNTSPTSAIIQVVASASGGSGIYGGTTATASAEL